MRTPDEYREMAVQDYQTEGEILIPILHGGDFQMRAEPAGAWVSAWVWVSDERFDNGEEDR